MQYTGNMAISLSSDVNYQTNYFLNQAIQLLQPIAV